MYGRMHFRTLQYITKYVFQYIALQQTSLMPAHLPTYLRAQCATYIPYNIPYTLCIICPAHPTYRLNCIPAYPPDLLSCLPAYVLPCLHTCHCDMHITEPERKLHSSKGQHATYTYYTTVDHITIHCWTERRHYTTLHLITSNCLSASFKHNLNISF